MGGYGRECLCERGGREREVGEYGRQGGDEFVAGGCETEACGKGGGGVEVVCETAEGRLGGARGVEDGYVGTVDLCVFHLALISRL